MINIFKVSRRDYIRRIREAAEKLEPKIRREFLQSVERIESSITLRELAEAIESMGLAAVNELIRPEALERQFQTLTDEIIAGVAVGGAIAAEHATAILAPRKQPIGGFEVRFNQLAPSTVQFLQDYRATLIRQITEDTRTVATKIISRGVTAGDNPLKTAREIRERISLTARQEQAVANYRSYLENLDRSALDRALRDKRFDSTLRSAIQNDKAIPAEKVDRMVERYRQKYLRYRSETIARTESLRAVNSGDQLLWEQAVQEGLVDPRQIRREWIYTHDSRTRDAHRSIPRMNENGVPLGESFRSPLGPIRFPHDPSASAANTVNCRCTTFTGVLSEELIQ